MEILSKLREELKCGLCSDLAEKAVETTCCKAMYCEHCLTEYAVTRTDEKKCPLCTADYIAYRVNDLARRMIEQLPYHCPLCDTSFQRSEKNTHQKLCSKRTVTCPDESCRFEGLTEDYIHHFTQNHREALVENATYLFKTQPVQKNNVLSICPFPGCDVIDSKAKICDHVIQIHNRSIVKEERQSIRCPICENAYESREEIIDHLSCIHGPELNPVSVQPTEEVATGTDSDLGELSIVNSAGREVTLAQNGKFYCGRNSVIGPAETPWPCVPPALNCNHCMELDCNLRNLEKEWLVNANGVVAKPKWLAIGSIEKKVGSKTLARPAYYCGGTCNSPFPCSFCSDLTNVMSQVQEWAGNPDDLVHLEMSASGSENQTIPDSEKIHKNKLKTILRKRKKSSSKYDNDDHRNEESKRKKCKNISKEKTKKSDKNDKSVDKKCGKEKKKVKTEESSRTLKITFGNVWNVFDPNKTAADDSDEW